MATNRFVLTSMCLVAAACLGVAAERDPTGTWQWTIDANGHRSVTTLRLKLDGEKLTGMLITSDGRQTPIEDGKYEQGTVSFKVANRRSSTKDRYSGKLKGDTITGQRKFDVGVQFFTFKRVKQ